MWTKCCVATYTYLLITGQKQVVYSNIVTGNIVILVILFFILFNVWCSVIYVFKGPGYDVKLCPLSGHTYISGPP